jgi:AcrR family transcriptional regulator
MSAVGTARRRRAVSDEEKSARRDQILAAAKTAFATKGYAATTIADIARAAELSYGSVYWYFASKEDLFDALIAAEEAALRDHLARSLRGFGPDTSAEILLRHAVQATFEFFEADRDTVRLLFRDSTSFGDRFEQHLFGIYERFIDDLETLVVIATTQGQVIDAPSRLVAFSVAALVSQLALRRLSTDDGVTAAQAADFVVSMILDGLRPRHGGTS